MHALLHPSVVVLVALAAHAACGDNGGAEEVVAKLRAHGLRESQLDLAVSVAPGACATPRGSRFRRRMRRMRNRMR
ncbi:MAG: hypothetical protein ACOZDY_17310 [Pseudomonadota bacterium]